MGRVAPGTHFGDALIRRVRQLGHPLCVGLDPHLDQIPELFRRGSMAPGDPETAAAVEDFLLAVLERAAPRVAITKPQSAFFEQLGWPGIRALARVIERAREVGLPLLLDVKRGDIGSTAEGYARAYLASDAPLRVDAITVNPYLGRDTLSPYVKQVQDHGCGLFVLTKTSNPGSGDYQDLEVDGTPLYERVAASLAETSESLAGPQTGWSSLGLVVGATYPAQAERLRALAPRALFLVPGYGTQGGSAADAVRGFARGPSGLEGGVVSSSRSILFPLGSRTSSADAWERGIDAALDLATEELATATR